MPFSPTPFVPALAVLSAIALPAAHANTVTQGAAPAVAAAPAQTVARIDYSYWDEALRYFVYRMGRSDRRAAPYLAPRTGTRLVYGHESRLRLEGNRVAFSLLDAQQVAALTAYREDLQAIADQVGIANLPRNEQLAFWINLHNVAVIEQIALAYPVKSPSRIKFGPDRLPLDEAKFITVGGTTLSPKDIRTRIVYPGWKDPKVVYGFFRGEIGGPTIQREAFTGNNVSALLNDSASEFVNSLRGTEKQGGTLRVSTLYAEAAPYFFPDFENDLRAHLRRFATPELRDQIQRTSRILPTISDNDVSDLAGGEEDPELLLMDEATDRSEGKNPNGTVAPRGRPQPGIARNISRLAEERDTKINRMLRRGELVGKVTVIDGEGESGEEVE